MYLLAECKRNTYFSCYKKVSFGRDYDDGMCQDSSAQLPPAVDCTLPLVVCFRTKGERVGGGTPVAVRGDEATERRPGHVDACPL